MDNCKEKENFIGNILSQSHTYYVADTKILEMYIDTYNSLLAHVEKIPLGSFPSVRRNLSKKIVIFFQAR